MKLSKRVSQKRRNIRGLIKGTKDKPRLSIFRSNSHIYAQIIDDTTFNTLVSCSSIEKDIRINTNNGNTCEASKIIGQKLAERSLKANIKEIIFDRGPYTYHGRVEALARAAREAGLEF